MVSLESFGMVSHSNYGSINVLYHFRDKASHMVENRDSYSLAFDRRPRYDPRSNIVITFGMETPEYIRISAVAERPRDASCQ